MTTTVNEPATAAGRQAVKMRGLFGGETLERASEWVRQIEQQAAERTLGAEALDVERLGFTDLLDVADAILRNYPPDTIVCSHHVKADRGALTTAAIADLIAAARLTRERNGL